MEIIVHQRADTAEIHATGGRRGTAVVNVAGKGGVPADEHVVLPIHAVIPVATAARTASLGIGPPLPVAAEGKVHVPREHLPFAVALAVTVVIVILVTAIDVATQEHGGEFVHDLGDIRVVEEIIAEIAARQRGGGSDHGLKIILVLVLAGLLFRAAHGGGAGFVNLVECALLVALDALQIVGVAVLHDVPGALEGAIHLHARGHHVVVGGASTGVAEHVIGEHVSHLRLVWVGGEQVDVIDARLAFLPAEIVVRVEVNVVALLRKAPAGLAVQVEQHVVVKLAQPVDRAAHSGIAVSRAWRLDEPVQHWQRVGQDRITHHCAVVLRGAERVGERRVARQPVRRVRGGDVVANQLPVGRNRARHHGSVNAIPGHAIRVQAVIEHHHVGFATVHDAVIEPDGGHGAEGGCHACRDVEVLVHRRLVRLVIRVRNDWSERGGAGSVGGAGRRAGEVIARRGADHRLARAQFRHGQKVEVGGAEVQRLDGQHVGADLEQILHAIESEFDRLEFDCIRACAGGGGIPRGNERGVGRGDQRAVEPGREAVIVLHAQAERTDARRISDVESIAQPRGCIDVGHHPAHVRRELIGQRAGRMDDRIEEAIVPDDIQARLDGEVEEVANLHGDGN